MLHFKFMQEEKWVKLAFWLQRAVSYFPCTHLILIQWHLEFKLIYKHSGHLLEQSVPPIPLQGLSSLTHCLSSRPCYTDPLISSPHPLALWRLTRFTGFMDFNLYLTKNSFTFNSFWANLQWYTQSFLGSRSHYNKCILIKGRNHLSRSLLRMKGNGRGGY